MSVVFYFGQCPMIVIGYKKKCRYEVEMLKIHHRRESALKAIVIPPNFGCVGEL